MPKQSLPARGSLRSRGAATISSVTLRQISAMLPPERAWGLWASRQIVARVMDTFGPSLAGTRVERVDVRLADGRRVIGEWVRWGHARWGHARSAGDAGDDPGSSSNSAIYYIHGSGYALCSPRTHRRLTAWLSRLTRRPVFCIDYRLAPKYRFPTAADDVRAGWDWLRTDCGLAPERMVIAGDSAGGHLAVDDPAIRASDAAKLIGLYCSGTDLGHHRLTLDVAGGRRMPPTLIQAGGAEMLRADAHALDAEIRTAGGTCELQVWPDQVHVFQALPRLTPEARPAMRRMASFVSQALGDNTIDQAAG